MKTKRILSKVAGVTFEGRQEYLKQIWVTDACRLEPEPDNIYDPNAIKVLVAHSGQVWHVGYLPRELALEIAPFLEGEAVMAEIVEVAGGFEFTDGDTASLGLRIALEFPDELAVD